MALQQAMGANLTCGARPLVATWAASDLTPACTSFTPFLFGFVEGGPFGQGEGGFMTLGLILGACGTLWCLAAMMLCGKCCPDKAPLLGDEGSSSPSGSKKDFFQKSASSAAPSGKLKSARSQEYMVGGLAEGSMNCASSKSSAEQRERPNSLASAAI